MATSPSSAAGFAGVFGALLLSGLAIFPGLNWLATYLQWNSALDYASFIGDATTWQRDTALFVPLLGLLVSLVALAFCWRGQVDGRIPALLGTVVGAGNLAFTSIYFLLVPGPWLESPTYVAKLWAGALIALGLGFAAIVRDRSLGWPGWATGAVLVMLSIWAGRWEGSIGMLSGLGIALAGLGACIVTARLMTRQAAILMPAWVAITCCASIGVVMVGAQIEQNGRGFLGTYGQYPFRAAYVDYEGELLMASKIAAQRWLLDRTEPGERIGIWTDPDRLMASVAGMQLWGWYNNIQARQTLDRTESDALTQLAPDVIAMYAPERGQIEDFYTSLPPWSMPTPLECTTVPYLGVGNDQPSSCLTHLTWLR